MRKENMEKELKVKKSIDIKADISKVWEALTNPELTRNYFFGCEVISDWKTGSSIIFRQFEEGKEIIYVKGIILEIENGKFLKFTAWGPESGFEDVESNYTLVTYDLSETNRQTKMTITHENFNEDLKRYNDSEKGWSYLMTALKEYLENKPNDLF